MAEGKCASISRYLLIILNLIFWIIGVVLLGVGIWLVSSEAAVDAITDHLHITIGTGTMHAVGYTVLSMGFFMFLLGFCGCCGAIRESAIMLVVYITFMTVLLVVGLAAVVYIALEKASIEGRIRGQLLSDVHTYKDINNSVSDLDFIQAKFECCGADNFTNYKDNPDFGFDVNSQNVSVPASCCKGVDHSVPAQPIDWYQCQHEAKFTLANGTQLYTKGCFTILKGLIENNTAVLVGIFAGIVVLEILGIALGIFLCRNRTEYDYYDD